MQPLPFAVWGSNALVSAALAALLTYTLHAAIWTLAAAALARSSAWPSRTRCSIWRVAVLAPVATASLAQVLPLGLAAGDAFSPTRGIQVAWVQGAVPLAGGISAGDALWRLLGVLVVWGSLAGFVRWLVLALRFARRMRGRTAVSDARWLERLERLRLRTPLARVTLTQSSRIASPMVLGTAEICLPVGSLSLRDAELDSVLAHELSHLERRDGVWFPLVGVVAATLWLQPLCGWAAAHFRDSAEQACDDRAVELTRDARALARVLLQLASGASARVLAPGMVNAKRSLLARIRRLADSESVRLAQAPRPRILALFFCLGVLGTACPTLGVQVAFARALLPSSATQAARQASSSSRVRVLEAQQELRHLLATERWLAEQSLQAEQSELADVGGPR